MPAPVCPLLAPRRPYLPACDRTLFLSGENERGNAMPLVKSVRPRVRRIPAGAVHRDPGPDGCRRAERSGDPSGVPAPSHHREVLSLGVPDEAILVEHRFWLERRSARITCAAPAASATWITSRSPPRASPSLLFTCLWTQATGFGTGPGGSAVSAHRARPAAQPRRPAGCRTRSSIPWRPCVTTPSASDKKPFPYVEPAHHHEEAAEG